MIQDIGAHCYHNEYTPALPKSGDSILFYRERTVLVRQTADALTLPTFGELAEHMAQPFQNCTYLFSIDSTGYYFCPDLDPAWLPDFSFEDISVFRTQKPREICFALITGFHLFHWYETHKFCGVCGKKLVPDTKERMMLCPHCKATFYPVISPAVIIAVRDKNRLLLSKYAGRGTKRYALIAGFTEIGETLEQTVQREVMEEVGLKVKNIRYYKSQPWGLSGTLLAGFWCDLDGDDRITLDEEELASAQWFEREEIPYDDYDVSLTREMMIEFKKGRD